MNEITSRKNKTVLHALSLHDKKARDSEGLFFTEGKKLLDEALDSGRVPVRVFATYEYLNKHCELEALNTELFAVTDEVYSKITDESSPEGVFAIFEKTAQSIETKKSSVLLLEGIQDPGNLGTLIRCASAFGVSEVVTVGCADIYSPKTVRSTMGAIFKVPCTVFGDIDSAVEYARRKTDTVLATALHCDSIALGDAKTAFATLMIGSEGKGLSKRAIELSDQRVIIPIENIESLNASVAGAICMYDSMMKRKHND